MKFGKQLQLGTYEPWKEYYIQYNKLKRIINRLKFIKDKKSGQPSTSGADMVRKASGIIQIMSANSKSSEYTPLPTASGTSTKGGAIANKSDKTEAAGGPEDDIDFFPVILEEMEKINKFFIGKLAELRLSLEQITSKRVNVYRSHHTSGTDTDLTQLRDIYVELAALRSYCDLNQTGFYKIIKKYDKIMEENTLDAWMKTIERQPFATTPEPIQLMDVVTSLVSRAQLIEWERFATEQVNKVSDDIFPAVRWHGVAISLVVFIVSLALPVMTPNDPAASRCMALLLFVVCLWITEAIPYFATALLIPPLVTMMGVLRDPVDLTRILPANLAAGFVTDHIFNHTTMLLMGGYTISSAFSRCQLELRLASWLQEALGRHPKLFILAVMYTGLFLSMWISNHTAPILCATIILPIVRDLPSDSRFSKSLLLGLAFACNFGGMMTPISSLQNVLAVSYLEHAGAPVSFGKWLAVALPFCAVCTFFCWVLILFLVKPDDVKAIPVIVYDRQNIIGKKNLAVIVLSLLTVILFATSSLTTDVFGDIAIISLCFVAVMFGSGMLSEVDFNSLSWHTLFLVGGGNVLGKAVESSGLLNYLTDGITASLPLTHPWFALFYILLFVGTVATFVSHTVASIILMPVIANIGVSIHMPEVVVIGSAFAISAAMALPFSSFPNVNSLLIVDDFQRPYLNVRDFMLTGLPMSLITVALIATVGLALINIIIVG